MKKKALAIILGISLTLGLTGCNYKFFDTNWDFQYAYITLPNGEIKEVEIDTWAEDENSITIKSDDDQIYCVSYHNCFMTKEKWNY